MLALAGVLDLKMGGAGFRLYDYLVDNVSTYLPLDKHGPETYRRSVYHQNVRAMQADLISDFDGPQCAFSTPRRSNTTTPLQALALWNHSFTLDMATQFPNGSPKRPAAATRRSNGPFRSPFHAIRKPKKKLLQQRSLRNMDFPPSAGRYSTPTN